MSRADLARRTVAEGLGTALLVATVVGSGIMAERLAGGNVALALLANTLATGAGLIAILLALGPVSGAHLNPAVTLVDAWQGALGWRDVPAYVSAQLAGGLVGTGLAHAMFEAPLVQVSTRVRAGSGQLISEAIAAFGLLVVIGGVSRTRTAAVPFAVAAYVAAAYWFTASTSFANPAVTLARSFTDSFAGIRPADAPGFAIAQIVGAFAGAGLARWLAPHPRGDDR
jgi:glycerol uptake facilitator-like aquaporin